MKNKPPKQEPNIIRMIHKMSGDSNSESDQRAALFDKAESQLKRQCRRLYFTLRGMECNQDTKRWMSTNQQKLLYFIRKELES